MKGGGSLEKKKKPKIRSSVKHDRLLKQIAAKEKESAHDKRFESFEKERKKTGRSSSEKLTANKGSSDAKKKRKRKNVSSKESLQECLSAENPRQDMDDEDDEEDESEGEDGNGSTVMEESFDMSEHLKKQADIQNQMIKELKETAWKDRFPIKSVSWENFTFQPEEEEKKKNIKKPSIPKVKGFHSWWNWNRTGLHPQHFRTGLDLYKNSKLDTQHPSKILPSPLVFDRLDSDNVQFIESRDPIQISCCVCNKQIHGLAIPIWKGFHSHEACMSSFGYDQ